MVGTHFSPGVAAGPSPRSRRYGAAGTVKSRCPTRPATTEPALVVIGAGAAGLYTALRAAREGAHVTLVSRH